MNSFEAENNQLTMLAVENTDKKHNVFLRTVATAGLLAGSVGALTLLNANSAESNNEPVAAFVDNLDACVDGEEDKPAFPVNSSFLNVPFKEGFLVEAVCVETSEFGFERLEQDGAANVSISFPVKILNASVDYEPDPNSTTTTTEEPIASTTIAETTTSSTEPTQTTEPVQTTIPEATSTTLSESTTTIQQTTTTNPGLPITN